MKYTKQDVEFHSDGYGQTAHPAVNVKVRNFGNNKGVSECGAVMAAFKCSEAVAEKACEFAFDSACRAFWDGAQDVADEAFGKGVAKVYQEGRSGGWLVVHGLPDLESWDAVMLGKWRKFEREIKADVADHTSWEYAEDAIRANRWAEEGAFQYNFIDGPDGKVLCFADLEKVYRDKRTGKVVEGLGA